MSELTLEEGLAFRQKLARRSKLRLKLQISAGALLAIVSAGHVISGVLDGDVAAKSLSVFGLMVGSAGTYVGINGLSGAGGNSERQLAAATNSGWLDNAAGNYKLIVNAGDQIPMDIPASNDPREALQKISQELPQQVRLPDLKPWGLNFRGARLVAVEGRPAAQLVYNTDNKAIGPLTLVIGATQQPDIAPTVERKQDVNLLYWRHHGRSYALAGQTDIGYLWGIANDVGWQLNAL